jgi:hypothetical protein
MPQLVSEKSTVVRPGDAAVTVYAPAMTSALKGAEATPELLVASVIVVEELLNVPLG